MTRLVPASAGRIRCWRERGRQGVSLLIYRLARKMLDHGSLGRWFDYRAHEVIAVSPWRLRLPPRLARELGVRELQAADAGALERLRGSRGVAYLHRFAHGHRALGAFIDDRLVAFLWFRCGPAEVPSSFGCSWQLATPMAWLYDLYSDPQVLGAVTHLYAYLRRHPPGEACRQLVGQTDHDNVRSRLAHRSLGYEVRARIWSWRCGKRWLHLSASQASQVRRRQRWRWHRNQALIPLHLFTAAIAAVQPTSSAAVRAAAGRADAFAASWSERRSADAAPLRLQCECGRTVPLSGKHFLCVCGRELGHQSRGMAVVGTPMPYWGEIPQPEMAAVLARAEQAGWRTAIEDLLPEGLREYVGGQIRADFHDLLPLPPQARVLDLGAGWGGIATLLARHYEVVALEGVAERARFIALRGEQDGLERLTVINGDIQHTRFGLHQFDAIVANGILEWVALLDLSGPPTAVQLLCLYRLRELLARGGVLYLAIENRIGWSELLGSLDHSGLRFTSLLPRPLARWVCARSRSYRAHFNVGYRTYTYTHRGYVDLFAQVGLRIRSTWISPAGYNDPSKLVPLDGAAIRFASSNLVAPAGRRWGLRQRLRRMAAREWIWRWFGSDFVFLLEAVETDEPATAATEVGATAASPRPDAVEAAGVPSAPAGLARSGGPRA